MIGGLEVFLGWRDNKRVDWYRAHCGVSLVMEMFMCRCLCHRHNLQKTVQRPCTHSKCVLQCSMFHNVQISRIYKSANGPWHNETICRGELRTTHRYLPIYGTTGPHGDCRSTIGSSDTSTVVDAAAAALIACVSGFREDYWQPLWAKGKAWAFALGRMGWARQGTFKARD